jgi:uncharacterized protein DUF6915
MAHPHFHAVSSARKHGGSPEQYIALHSWFDESKAHLADFRHRASRHHAQGIFWAEEVFGETLTITLDDGRTKQVPVRLLGEQHVIEDLGRIPTMADWFRKIQAEPWMNRSRRLSRELEAEEVA